MKKVIICDDSRVSALAIQHFMTKNDVYIEGTAFGQKEFEKLIDTSEKPDFVSMDMVLPDGDGIQCCQKLWEKWSNLPVIFITKDKISDDQKSQLAHVKKYLLKPITNDTILEAITSI